MIQDNNPEFNREAALKRDFENESFISESKIIDPVDELQNIGQIYSDAVLYKVVHLVEDQMINKKNNKAFMNDQRKYLNK